MKAAGCAIRRNPLLNTEEGWMMDYDDLEAAFKEGANITAAGMLVQFTKGDFYPMLTEFVQQDYGAVYSGTPLYTCFNFATSFSSAVYDYSYNMTVDPSFYDDYSSYYIKDVADIYLNAAQ